MKSSSTCAKLYSKCINKSKTDIAYTSYMKYRNKYNWLKKIAKQTYYVQIIYKIKHDIRKTWKIINSTISKLNYKTATPQTFKIDNTNISDPNIITDNFCDLFINLGVNYANNIPLSVKIAHNYINLQKTRNPNSTFLTPTDPNEILEILKTLIPQNSFGHDPLKVNWSICCQSNKQNNQ